MTDKPKIVVTDPHQIPVTFVSSLVNHGYGNGVVNLSFATARYVPDADGAIVPDLVLSALLRMDMACAVQLRDALSGVIEQHMKPANGTTH
jgi:hypothetical protein